MQEEIMCEEDNTPTCPCCSKELNDFNCCEECGECYG